MARPQESRPDPLTQGRGRTDEVDQSRGFFPPGVPHPEGAEVRAPGSIGGGPYDESGRGGIDVSPGQSTSGTSPGDERRATGQGGGEARQDERPDEDEPRGALPAHEQKK